MKMAHRERIEGTQVTIGRRVYVRGGRERVSRCYTAEYRDPHGKQRSQPLGVNNVAQARRLAIEVQQRIDRGERRPVEPKLTVEELANRYYDAVEVRELAPRTLAKYRADLDKLRDFCRNEHIKLAARFREDDLHRFRRWLITREYAPKTVQGAVVLAKQVFKWGSKQKLIREYALAAVSLPKAKARPQPCFTSEQVDRLIGAAAGEEQAAFAFMGYAGLRIGEVEQLRFEDLRVNERGQLSMIHVRRGGSAETTKNKDDRFVPVHPRIAEQLRMSATTGNVFTQINARRLLKRLKLLCKRCGFAEPRQYKLHSFRHHFASLCANHHVAYRKALAWLGHSSSEMLDLYYHLHDDDSQQAMQALAAAALRPTGTDGAPSPSEDNLRARSESKIEKALQVPEFHELAETLSGITERAGFEPADRLPYHRFSKPARSATPAPLHASCDRRHHVLCLHSIHFSTIVEGTSHVSLPQSTRQAGPRD